MRPLKVFLCHSRFDKPAVRDLYRRLKADGVQPWLDEEDLLPGQRWPVEIPRAVRQSDVVLVCLSQTSVTKAGFVQREIKLALDVADEQPEGSIYVIPVRLEEVDAPERLADYHWVNLFDERGYERLLRSLRAQAERVGAAAPQPAPTQVPAPPPLPDIFGRPTIRQSDPQAPPAPRLAPTIPVPQLVQIPAGPFRRGTSDADIDGLVRNTKWAKEWRDKGYFKAEQPQREVYVSAFEIGRYPVTNREYAAFVQGAGHEPPSHWKGKTPPEALLDHPVVYVGWDDAVAYCRWLSQQTGKTFRLPTEAEWEKAARGTDGRHWPWGAPFDAAKCNSWEAGPKTTTPVGRYSPSGDSLYGCADMAGNVWEWCADWYDAGYYAEAPDRDPQGPDMGQHRVVRGGAFNFDEFLVRCASRLGNLPVDRFSSQGFRVVSPGL